MGWASGSRIAEDVWIAVRRHIPEDRLPVVAQKIIECFESYDCDTLGEAEQLCEDAGRNLSFEKENTDAYNRGDYTPLKDVIEGLK